MKMKTTVLFFVSLIALTSIVSAQKAFDAVRNLIDNFRTSITDEQHDADVRNEKDVKKCRADIANAEAKVASRQKDVDSLKEHIKWLENEKSESEKDKKTREDRIVANNVLLEQFKKQRCDNNLIFVKQLREHMEAIEILKLLRGDINEYFGKKKNGKPNTAFLERFSEFSHLLSDEHKQIFLELSQNVQHLPDKVEELTKRVDATTATKQRTEEEVGKKHVDNNRGELKRREGVAFENSAEYEENLHKKILLMIDGLIKHLEESREELTKNEIKAAEDFAIFQSNMEKENEYLREKILELTKHIEDLTNQINVANAQLEKREKLLQEAKNELEVIKNICKEKEEYYASETRRRNGELVSVDEAKKIFNDVLSHLSERVRNRASEAHAGEKLTGELNAHVVKSEPGLSKEQEAREKERHAVVFVEEGDLDFE